MVQQRLLANTLATFAAAFIALWTPPDSAHAQGYYYINGFYINGFPASPEVALFMAANGLLPGYYWLDASGNWGVVGNPQPLGNIYGPLRHYQNFSESGHVYGPWESDRFKILETGFSLLTDLGREEPGYGLYSYAILVNDSDRSAIFLRDVFSAIPPVEDTAAERSQTNVFYIPMNNNKLNELVEALSDNMGKPAASIAAYAKNLYDYKMSRALLDHLCGSPAEQIGAVCEGDLSRGPYIFSYARPASKLAPVPPPFLFMDLSDVHERAFPEIIAAFRAQVKRDDISDRAKIDTLRLKLLSIVLTAADFVAPVQKAVADIVHTAGGRAEGDKK